MTSNAKKLVGATCGLVLLVCGCASPNGRFARNQSSAPAARSATVGDLAVESNVPWSANPIQQVAYPATHPHAVGHPQAATQPMVQQSVVNQVGCFGEGHGVCATCGQQGCSCHGCGCQPHGYSLLPPEGWNVYGLDPQEFICDGGDHPPPAVVLKDDSIAGLQPEDTVVHYTTEAGDIEIRESNRVCLYAPRFLSVRKITGAHAGERAVGPAQVDNPLGAIAVEHELPGLVLADSKELLNAEVARHVDAMRERTRGVPVENVLQPILAEDVLAALAGLQPIKPEMLIEDQKALVEKLALAAVVWTLDESLEVVVEDLKPAVLTRDQQVHAMTVYEFGEGRLRICKLADKDNAQVGEIVTFAIILENVGDAPVERVVLTDNLTTRLEYVEGSQTCTGGAEFESFVNEGESLRLQWKLTDKLRVGESVTIRFKCRVR